MELKSATVSFILGRKRVDINFDKEVLYRPTTTLLEYLRSLPDRKGTKEGCAEGDCGACTVVITSLNPSQKLDYKACDSCLIFLPMLHGKQVLTVEDLSEGDNLHPVQQAMVDYDGSQCGYCTPGFVMSLFSLYKKETACNRTEVMDALTGNLCRCTGYRSIIDASMNACKTKTADQFSKTEDKTIKLLQEIKDSSKTLAIKTISQQYFYPKRLKEVLRYRNLYLHALITCGGTDLALRVTKQKQLLEAIIDISNIDELKGIKEVEDGYEIGAATSLEEIRIWSKSKYPALFDCMAVFGSRQIRNLATLGGNLGSASPIGDSLPILMALKASVVLISEEGSRKFKVKDFITGYRETKLNPNEIIKSVILPKPTKNEQVKWYKISKRKDLDISTVSGGFCLDIDDKNRVKHINLYYGGMDALTRNARLAEQFLIGKEWNQENIEQAMLLIDKDFLPISDARASEAGRKVMARNLLMKFWNDTNIKKQLDLFYH